MPAKQIDAAKQRAIANSNARIAHVKEFGVSFHVTELARRIFAELTGNDTVYDISLTDEPATHTHNSLDRLVDTLLDIERHGVELARNNGK